MKVAVVTIVKHSDESAVRAKCTVESGTGASRRYDEVVAAMLCMCTMCTMNRFPIKPL